MTDGNTHGIMKEDGSGHKFSGSAGHHSWRVMIIGGAICTRLLQLAVSSIEVAEGDSINDREASVQQAGAAVTFDQATCC